MNRRQLATFLTDLLHDNRSGLVLNLNAAWGTGKTFFMDRWRRGVTPDYATIWFNAWEADFTPDPLVGFVAELTSQLEALNKAPRSRIRRLAAQGARVSLRVAPVLIEATVRKALGDSGFDAIKDFASPETEETLRKGLSKAALEAVREHLKRRESVREFRSLLEESVRHLCTKASYHAPLYVFVDELDRCRPTYALALLEDIKHRFAVAGVVFVVATDTTELEKSVRAVYGPEFDSATYLHRFFDQTFQLPEPTGREFAALLHATNSLDPLSGQQIFCPNDLEPVAVFAEIALAFRLSLRDQEQAHMRIRAVIKAGTGVKTLHYAYLCILVMARFTAPKASEKIRRDPAAAKNFVESVGQEFGVNVFQGHGCLRYASLYFSTCSTAEQLEEWSRTHARKTSWTQHEMAVRALVEAVRSDSKGFRMQRELVDLAQQVTS